MRARLAAATTLVAVLAAALAGCGTTVPMSQQQAVSDGLGPAPSITTPTGSGSGTGSGTGGLGGTAAGGGGAASGGTGTAGGGSGTTSGTGTTGVPGPAALAPIQVGIITQGSTGDVGKSIGLGATDNGDEAAYAKIVVEDLNRHGGLAGHRIDPVIYNIDSSQTGSRNSDMMQAACAHFTQDHHVVAALPGWHARGTHLFEACMQQRKAVTVDPNAQYTGDPQILAKYPYYVTPNGLGLDRIGDKLPGALGRSFFGKEPVGVISVDNEQHHRQVDAHLKPALAAIGAQLKTVFYISEVESTGDLGRTSGELSNAILRFRSDGVTRVLDLTGAVILFAPLAESQGYRPRYGLTSQSTPAALIANGVPAAQLHGALGLGWAPVLDVNMLRPAETPPAQKRCLDLLASKGQRPSGASVLYVALTFCEQLGYLSALADAVPAGQPITGDTLRNAFGHVAEYQSAMTFTSAVTASRRDGVAAYRVSSFDDSCTCFRYTTAPARPTR